MNWRVILAIARKDIVDTIKNQWLFLGLILPIGMSLLFRLFFPGPEEFGALTVAVYDPGGSRLVAALRKLPDVQLLEANSDEQLRQEVESKAAGGLALPAGFDAAVDAGERPELIVYRNYRAGGFEQAAFRQLVEQQVWALTGREMPARLTLVDVAKPPGAQAEEGFQVGRYLLIVLLLFALGMTGNVVVPTLLVEEKEKHTLQVLLISPASPAEVIAGKALTGLVYTLLVAGALFVLNPVSVGDWPVVVLAVLLGSLFMVLVGLLIGGLCRTTTQVNTWATLVMTLLVLPSFLIEAVQPSALVETVVRLIPTHYLVEPLGLALAGEAPPERVWLDLAVLAGSAIVAFVAVVWLLRREER